MSTNVSPDEAFRFEAIQPIMGAPVGTRFALCENTYDLEVCDVCGKRRKCDYFECWCFNPIVGFDCCRACKKEVLKEDEE